MKFIKNKKDRHGIALLAGVVIFSLVTILAYQRIKHDSAYDEATLCPLHIPYDSTIVIIDKSDPWAVHDADKIVSLVMRIAGGLDTYERLQIRVIHAKEKNGQPVISTLFDMCNPGSKANPLYQNPRKIKARYDAMFKGPLQEVADFLTRPGQAKHTPLLHAIATAVSESEGQSKELIIISDLLENTHRYNFYKNAPEIEEILDTYSLKDKGIRSITIKYILRNNVAAKLESRAKQIFRKIAERINAAFDIDNFLEV